ncbi:tetratricopeptide repeat protein [Pontibacter sp. KCTC 32443]|uniref:tetratricopeptide repeat protein n=1 Tax=Pontibacter TaxID=323449 RepID=UPI00164E3CC3|nr:MULTISPECIES: tetratricopeptide repeat protein [Pontibacter]MBC5774990.1 tetratricopeptide repeat protein [Pontibacter sp. KCTC 32443]
MKNIAFYSCLILLPIVQVLRAQDISGSNLLLLLLLSVLFIYFAVQAAKEIIHRKVSISNVSIYTLLLLSTITLFAKYFGRTFWDYPSFLIIPSFIIFFIYFIRKKDEPVKLKAVTSVYMLFMVPLFLLIYGGALGDHVPSWWYQRYQVGESSAVELPYSFEYAEAENLSVQGFELRKQEKYEEAILVYKHALQIEPKNPRLYFDLSTCYAYTNQLGKAVSMLNTAIKLDSAFAPFYNNRGLLHYQLYQNKLAIRDYKAAIALDSTEGTYYANLALAQNDQGLISEACVSVQKATVLGTDVDNYDQLKKIINNCHQQKL